MTQPDGTDRSTTPDPTSARHDWRTTLDAAPLLLLWGLARRLPYRLAGTIAGGIFASIGPLTSKQRHVKRNLSFVKPAASDAELSRLARAVWRNLGRVLAEFPHLEQILATATRVEIPAAVQALLDERRPLLILTAHMGNWELLGTWLGRSRMPLTAIYDRHDNPILEARILDYRGADNIRLIDKSAGLRSLLAAGREGRSIALLQDSRVDTGIPLPFFGVDAWTTTSPAKIAWRFDYPVVPAVVLREPDGRFLIRFEEPLTLDRSVDEQAAATDLVRQYHAYVERWILSQPGNWLCTKRRWPKTASPVR